VIALTGFMGTGKTSVGKRLAARLGWIFVDTDDIIAARERRSIEAIFAAEGEPYFRAREREAVAEAAALRDVVIATGGGAVVDEGNFETLRRAGLLVCLTATPEEILRRTQGHGRPLLRGDRERRVRALLEERAASYARVPHAVDTTHLSVDEVVERILALHRADAGSPEEDG
jgi:shikimate kinase